MAARAVTAFVVVVPFALAQLVVIGVARRWSAPSGLLPRIGWWLVLAAISFVIVEATLVVTRRLLPLATLLRLSMAFPAVAPDRFRLALQESPTQVRASLDRIAPASDTETDAYETMMHLVFALDDHDRLTRGHSERVRAYGELIADELGLPTDERHRLRWAGLLHDVGKLRTPASILRKRGPLTEEEFAAIRHHPLDGLDLAAPLAPWLGEYILAVSDHHERWSGGGYPAGTVGEDISRAGRIVSVIDAFDVMTSVRSYSTARSVDLARTELLDCAGTQFDPEIVRAFLAIPVRRLRAIVGPLSLLSPLLSLRERLPAVLAQAGIVTGSIGIVGVATLLVPTELAPSAAAASPTEQAAVVAGPFGTDTNAPIDVLDDHQTSGAPTSPHPGPSLHDDPTVPARLDSGPHGDQTRPTSGPTHPTPTAPPTDPAPGPDEGPDRGPDGGPNNGPSEGPGGDGTDPARPTGPDDPGGPGGGQDPGQRTPVAIVIDPGASEIVIEGMAVDGQDPTVGLGPGGAVVCGAADVCQPVVIETPIVFPANFPLG